MAAFRDLHLLPPIFSQLCSELRNIASGPGIVCFCGLHGPLLPQNTSEKVKGFAPDIFQWVLRSEGAI